MDRDTIKSHLNNLEKSVRYLGRRTGWLFLESINPEVLDELSHLSNQLLPDDQAARKLSEIIKPPVLPKNRYTPAQDQQLPDLRKSVTHPVKETITPSSSPNLDPLAATNLDSLKLRLRDCNRCSLCENRSTVVFGQGNQKSEIVFIGEAPGEEEDRTGLAFVGKAGKLLTQIIHSIGLNREAVYICNIVKCRPPGNRNPNSDEMTSCFPFLKKQLEFLKPKLIVTMGNVATQALVPDAVGIMKMRGRIIDYKGTTLIPTFHPSYLLRTPSALADVWIDMRKIRQTFHQQILNSQS